jgi:hypothetical protein
LKGTAIDRETLKAGVKRLSSQAVQAKMNLHDLAEELPIGYEEILSVAQRAYDTYRELESKRAQLRALGE